MRHFASSDPSNSISASVYSPTGGEGTTVHEVDVDLPQLVMPEEEESLPSGLTREGIVEWIRAKHVDLELRHLRYQIRYTYLLEKKYKNLLKRYT